MCHVYPFKYNTDVVIHLANIYRLLIPRRFQFGGNITDLENYLLCSLSVVLDMFVLIYETRCVRIHMKIRNSVSCYEIKTS
jgi:hypothetical protein